jgi:hypothetical protein
MPRQSSSVRKAPVMVVDPYAQQMVAYAKPGDAAPIPDRHREPIAAGGASTAVRLIQLALLSSLAVMLWFMLSMLQHTG